MKPSESATKPASNQADNSRAFAPQVSKNDAAIEAKKTDNESGLGAVEDAELRNQLDAEVSGTHIGADMCSEEITTIRGVIEAIQSEHFREQIENLRGILEECGDDKSHPDFKAEKLKLDAVVIAGKIEGEIARAWERGDFEPSGFLQIDIDDLADAEMVREELRAINYILSSFVSPSGDGVKAIAYIGKSRDANDFKNRFEAVEKDMARRGHIIDTTCKNPNRLMFASWDADAWTRNSAAIPLKFPKSSLPPAKAKDTKPISKSVETPENVPVSQKLVKSLKAKSPMARNLYETGDWKNHSFASQSEADFSLSCSICEITADPDQHEALFQTSALYRDERRLTLALRAARRQVAKDSAMPKLSLGGGGDKTEDCPKSLSDYRVDHSDTLNMSWQEIDALRPPYVIDGFLRWGEVLLLGAESKSRKSWLAQDAGFAVAAGLPWLADEERKNGFATAQARVHVFDLELNPSEMRYRYAKARGNRFADSPEDAAAMTAVIAAYSFDGQNVKEIMQRLEELKATVRPGDLVIVDCLYRLCPDGNEVGPLADILEAVKRFASETQAGVILVDHFRKAGDEKARNRFAGSFIKQASASTLVAIEVTSDNVLVLNIDARTFHGCPRVYARFNPLTYAFNRLPEIEVEKAKQESKRGETERWLHKVFPVPSKESFVTTATAAERWGIKRQGAVPRLEGLASRSWLIEKKTGAGKPTEWILAPDGAAVLEKWVSAPSNLHPSLHL